MNLALKIFRTKNRVMGFVRPQSTIHQAKELFLTPRKFPVKDWEKKQESSGVRTKLENGLSVISWGQSARKVLLVHGWESRATQMSGFVEPLLKQGFQVYALDGPAHGHSEGKRANPYVFAQAVSYVYKHLGPFEGVIAHSMGGSAVSVALSQMDTDSVSRPGKVVLISSPSSIHNVLDRFANFIGLSETNAANFARLIENAVGQPTQALSTASNVRELVCEGLIIHDKSDREVPYEDAVEIAKNWKSSRLFSTEGLGHRAIIRQPAVWKEVADFLA